ncbi:MAG: hypothetical protein AB4372_12800 [Xenococcus sp. (in: cyanobacteria)]
MSFNVLRSSPFAVKYPSHGGEHRSEQILEILSQNNIQITELQQSVFRQARPIKDRILGSLNSLRNYDWDAFCERRLGGIGQMLNLYHNELTINKKHQAIIWETTGETITPQIKKKYQVPLIALPHNIESFFMIHFKNRNSHKLFDYLKQELKGLKTADFVFAVSVEEQIFLRNYGIEAEYLPYYPGQRLIDIYSDIRQARKISQKQSFLILGSAKNHANVEGFLQLTDWINNFVNDRYLEVKLVGNQTESLKDSLNYPWLQICGTATETELKQYLTETRAVLIHQTKGLGVLTRIPEMLVAGIPIIANRIAARSATHLPGVYIYDSPEELHHLLTQEFEEVPMPQPPKNAESRFIQAILANQ